MLFKIYTTLLSKQFVLIEKSSNQEKKREKILHFLFENPGVSNKTILKSCRLLWEQRRALWNDLRTDTIKRKSASGRKKGFAQWYFAKKVKDALDRNLEISVRTLANNFKTSASTIQRVKRNCGYKSYKKKKVPRHEEKQENVAIRHSKLLYKNHYVLKNLVWLLMMKLIVLHISNLFQDTNIIQQLIARNWIPNINALEWINLIKNF